MNIILQTVKQGRLLIQNFIHNKINQKAIN